MAEITGLHIQVTSGAISGDRDVWLHFKSENGKSAMLSVAAMAEKKGGIIGAALRGWAEDRVAEFDASGVEEEARREAEAANGQFGVGA